MDLPEIRKKISLLQKQRDSLENILMQTRAKMEAGSLVQIYTACRKGNCKCTRGEKHGPFLYLSQKVDRKLKQRYVGKKSDEPTVKKVRTYMQYQDRLATLRKIYKQIDTLFNQYREISIEMGGEINELGRSDRKNTRGIG